MCFYQGAGWEARCSVHDMKMFRFCLKLDLSRQSWRQFLSTLGFKNDGKVFNKHQGRILVRNALKSETR